MRWCRTPACLAGLLLMSATVPAEQPQGPEVDAAYAALDPRGIRPPVERIPLSPRVDSLQDKHVYLIDSWPKGSGFEDVLAAIQMALRDRYPGIRVTIQHRNTRYSTDDPELWQEMQANADAFIYAGAPSSSTTSYAFRWSGKLEKMGIPGAVLMFDPLLKVARHTRERQGAEIRYTAIAYPAETMDAPQQTEAIDELIAHLTRPLAPEETRTGTIEPPPAPRIIATGSLDDIQRRFLDLGLTDGLPIIPPTEDRVAAMLKGTSHDPDAVVAESMVPEALRVTVEKVAINAVMAGCEPAHMPVLLATLAAFQRYDLNSVVRSTNSFAFMQVVNGPIRDELEMNAGTQALGPGNHANATMGRALRLFIRNLGGGIPGTNMMAVVGSVANWPFLLAELEPQSPWEPLHVSRGFDREESTLTLFRGGWAHAGNYGHVRYTLDHVAADIAEFETHTGAVIIVSPKRAAMLHAEGLSKQDVIDHLLEQAVYPLGKLRTSHFFRESAETQDKPDDAVVPVYQPGSIEVVVAGGDASPMMQAWQMYGPVTVSIDEWR